MLLIRTLFYFAIAYFLSKLVRIFFEPSPKNPIKSKPSVKTPNVAPIPKQEKKSTLGDYVEFEEVKSA
jgi:hypothetical protein